MAKLILLALYSALMASTVMCEFSQIANLTGGHFVSAWSLFGQNEGEAVIYHSIYDSNNDPILNASIIANIYYTHIIPSVSVVGLHGGNYVVVWTSLSQSEYYVYYQVFNGTGTPVSDIHQADSNSSANDCQPYVALMPSGRFVISYRLQNSADNSSTVYYRIFDDNGSEAGPAVEVADQLVYDTYPTVAVTPSNNTIVTWQTYDQQSSNWTSYYKRFDSNGANISNSILVCNGYILYPYSKVITLIDNSHVIVYQAGGPDLGTWVYFQRYKSDNSKFGSLIEVTTAGGKNDVSAHISSMTDGGFLISWLDSSTPGLYQVNFARYTIANTKLGLTNIIANAVRETYVSCTGLSGDYFIIMWEAPYAKDNICLYGQKYEPLNVKYEETIYIYLAKGDEDVDASMVKFLE